MTNTTNDLQAERYHKSACEVLDELIREHIRAFMTIEEGHEAETSHN